MAIKKAVGSSGKATMTKETTSQNSDGEKVVVVSDPVEEQVVPTKKSVAIPTIVGVEAGMTINTGNFSSIRLGVYLSVTVEPEEIDDAFEAVSTWVSEKLQSMADGVN